MKKRKLILTLIIAFTVIFFAAACGQKDLIEDERTITMGLLSGPTGMGAAKLMDEGVNLGENAKLEFNLYAAPDQISADIINGTLDIAALPTNLAAVLYNKTDGEVLLGAVNTLGTLYVISKEDAKIESVEDLAGKTIYSSGQGATPEYILRYILENNGIDPDNDVNIRFFQEHAEAASQFAQDLENVVVLPEPFVTSTLIKMDGIETVLDLTIEWEKATQGKSLPMGCIVVSKEFASTYPEALSYILEKYEESIEYVTQNPAQAATLIVQQGILPQEEIAENAIDGSNIVYISAQEAKDSLESYYDVLFKFNPGSIGGEMPDDEFYYSK